MGLAEDLRAAQVKIFCPKCEQARWRKTRDFGDQPSRASTTGLACHRSAAGLCCQKQIQRAWRSFFWDVQLSCFQNSFCESMAFHRNFEGVEWLVFFRTSRSSYWNIPSSVESVHILFMPSSDSLAVVSLLHAFHWDFLPQFWKFVVRTLSLEKSITATSVLQVVPADLSANLSNPTSTGDTEASLLFILQTRWLCRLCIKIAFLRVQMSTAWARHEWDVSWNFHPLVGQALLSAWGRLSLEFSVPSSDPIY